MMLMKEIKRNYFDEKLKECRRFARIDQRRLADLCNVSLSTVKKWESGDTRPTPAHMEALKMAFGKLPEHLMIELLNEYKK